MGKRIKWDDEGKRLYETGVKNGVLYTMDADGEYEVGVPWNGLTGVTEKATGAEATKLYADDTKYLELRSTEEYEATVEAYTYPDKFAACNGEEELATGITIGQQTRKRFGLCYRTTVGNDTEGENYGYKLHLIYGATASPSEKAYETVNDSPNAITFSWDITTVPVQVEGFKPTASLTIDSKKVGEEKMTLIENALYGTDGNAEGTIPATDPKLLLPDEILDIING